MRFYLFWPLLLLISCVCLNAHGIDSVMQVTSADGSIVKVKLVDNIEGGSYLDRSGNDSVIHLYVYTGDMMKDEQGIPVPNPEYGNPGEILFDAPVSDITHISFKGRIGEVESPGLREISIDIRDGIIKISGVEEPVEMSVMTLSGITIMDKHLAVDSEVDLRTFGKGVYLIKIGTESFKILVRE